MASKTQYQNTFDVLSDTKPDDTTLSPFMVSTPRGFLPRADPMVNLPDEFNPLETLLRRMPIKRADGLPGLLAEGSLGEEVKTLPDLTADIQKKKHDLILMTALYRDYSFLASAYLLEPCESSST
jgi:indoleamine 2,3-dioxygenase